MTDDGNMMDVGQGFYHLDKAIDDLAELELGSKDLLRLEQRIIRLHNVIRYKRSKQ
jgi:hypothetical protein